MKQDIYQKRYTAHQARKGEILKSHYGTKNFKKYTKKEQDVFYEILKNRRSQRAFTNEVIGEDELKKILEWAEHRPSSCGRRSIAIKVLDKRDDKDLISGFLVGGTGWMHRGSHVLVFMAWKEAYKSPSEREFMSYIDAGVLAQTLYLICEARNIGFCYVNPNIRKENQEFFYQRFIPEGYQFVGAGVMGYYEKKHTLPKNITKLN